MSIRARLISCRRQPENAGFQGLERDLYHNEIIVNDRKITPFIEKMGYEWGMILLEMGYEIRLV